MGILPALLQQTKRIRDTNLNKLFTQTISRISKKQEMTTSITNLTINRLLIKIEVPVAIKKLFHVASPKQ